MYRLLSIRYTPFMSMKYRPCSLPVNHAKVNCEMVEIISQKLSTTPKNAELLDKKKKRRLKPRYAKYVDLLEVTDVTANEKKSRVKRLKAKKLQDFLTTPKISGNNSKGSSKRLQSLQPIEYQKINMDIFDNASILNTDAYDERPYIFVGKEKISKMIIGNAQEIENILKSFNNFRDIIETMGSENHETDIDANLNSCSLPQPKTDESSALLTQLDLSEPYLCDENIVDAANQSSEVLLPSGELSKVKSSRFKERHSNNADVEQLAKERAIRINLNVYLKVCVDAGLLNRCLATLMNYRSRFKKGKGGSGHIITIDMYNTLLHGYAEKGCFDRFHDIFILMEEDGITFNEQTFAAIFECLGRLDDSRSDIEKFIKKARDMGITLNQIMDQSKFLSDQRSITLDAIRRVETDFEPIYTPPVLNYNNVLLNHLNDNRQIASTVSGVENNQFYYSRKRLAKMARDQLKTELDGYITINSIENVGDAKNSEYCREKLKSLESVWYSQICAAVARDLNSLKAQMRFKSNGYMNYYTYLKTLDTHHYTEILLKEVYKLAQGSETFSPTVGQLYKELGLKVQRRYQIEQKKKNGILEKTGNVYSSYIDMLQAGSSSDNGRQIWQKIVHEQRGNGPCMDIREDNWPPSVLCGVGRFLYNILMRDIKIDANVMRQNTKNKLNLLPAFYTLFRNQGRLVKEEVKTHPVLAKLLRSSRQKTLTFDASLVPMLCPPKPWSSPHNGGYLLNKSELIRLPHQAVQQWERINASNPQCLYPVLDSLNQLSSVPWRVNTDVLDIAIEVFQNGGNNELNVPQPPSSLPPLLTSDKGVGQVSMVERAKLFKQKLSHRRKQAEMYSLWCDTLYRLSLANHYREKVFWLPHNMDFRGRVYPIPPHLNHLGSDLARSMLIFDEARPLGRDGFNWLKLHCINLIGLKKRDSINERLLYADDVMDEILDSADNPLTGRMWWAKSDEPWQTLACCIEIAKVQRSPNPEEYLSHFPIHQDGSCNGLQHYAALGRDYAGAVSVNLVPSKVPQDVYSAVVELVEKTRVLDAENGIHVAQVLKGFVKRKVIKQTVMTTVYGVTRYGARLQIARQLKDINDFPKDWVWPASTYLTTKTFDSLREMFTSTREIQDWFTECARLISGTCGENVEWCTPLGLPVVQPYSRHEIKSQVKNSTRISETMSTDMYDRPNMMKQKNAFPPNFIHSLDSSHMMLTSLHCESEGITFVSVHDCFWTHPATVAIMNRICREQFVALHSQPILEDLSNFMLKKFGYTDSEYAKESSNERVSKRHINHVLSKMPPKGSFALENVLDSVYFFS